MILIFGRGLRMEYGGFGCFGSGASDNSAMRSRASYGARLLAFLYL
ncbi:MAG: hypothetical protein K1X86_12880 [Ignavibacteria bacterium]|nr:hypothetical protein [Ignavibacteria bacterium]